MESKGYTNIYNEVLKKIPSQYIKTYMAIAQHCYGDKTDCFPSQKVLSEIVGKSIRTIQRHIKYLVKLGVIKSLQRGFRLTNIYTVLDKVNQSAAAYANDMQKKVKELKEKCKKTKSNNSKTYKAKEKKELKFVLGCESRNYSEDFYKSLEDQFQDMNYHNAEVIKGKEKSLPTSHK